MPLVGISLGSNLGDRLGNLRTALEQLEALASSSHLLVSPVFETEPVGCPPGSPSFYNAVVEIETDLTPMELLGRTQSVERALGRPDCREQNAPRTVDLDLLYYDDLAVDEGPLTLPHPRMWERAFVLKPLARIRPDLVPPNLRTVVEEEGIQEIPERLR